MSQKENNRIGANGCKFLGEILRATTTLQELILCWNLFFCFAFFKKTQFTINWNSSELQLEIKLGSKVLLFLVVDSNTKMVSKNWNWVSIIFLPNYNIMSNCFLSFECFFFAGSNDLGVNGIKCLCDALNSNKSLSSIDIGMNKIGDEGCSYIAFLLSKNRSNSLTEIILGFSFLFE